MGVRTEISLYELNKIFSRYQFIKLVATNSGIIDTTYIVYTKDKSYILKKYERDIPQQIASDIKLLSKLKSIGLNTPICLDQNNGWYLYEKLLGDEPKNIQTYHIQAVARFLSKFHTFTNKQTCYVSFINKDEIKSGLNYTKSNHFHYFKKLSSLINYNFNNDGLIHGDIFKDNTVFQAQEIGVFDFIDSACGNFAFDVAVALVGFDSKNNNYYINLFLNTYNQHAPRKISKNELLLNIDFASKFYALQRIHKQKRTKNAKGLLR